ncbi:MAG TPA: antibiotic biosynthesis monooxygenase [Candidatus Solibacter sp.]|nr:antibiotic biosynthesis monooxygenase [Candidatus Solibacter sp.]
MFLILWEFDVKRGSEKEFESIYGPNGDWAQLFRLDPGYQSTSLLRDISRVHVYLTCDFWKSREAYESFRRNHLDVYLALDKKCGELTIAERKIGAFEQIEDEHP